MAESSPTGKKTQWEKEKFLVTSNFSFSHIVFNKLILQTRKNQELFEKGLWGRAPASQSWGSEFESRERVSILGFFIGPHIRREYWCSSQEAESREISISCKNLFLNRCKINTFKLNQRVNKWYILQKSKWRHNWSDDKIFWFIWWISIMRERERERKREK